MKPKCSCRYWGAVQGFVDLTRQKTPQLPNVPRGNGKQTEVSLCKKACVRASVVLSHTWRVAEKGRTVFTKTK